MYIRKKEYQDNALVAIYNYNGKDVFCEILEDMGNLLKVKGQFKTAKVMPKKEIRVLPKSKLDFLY